MSTGSPRLVSRRTTLLGAAGALVASSLGCGPAWSVVRQAVPNPLVGQTRFAVGKPSFAGVLVEGRPEAEWRGERPDETRSSWESDKREMADLFASSLANRARSGGIQVTASDAPKAAPFLLRPRVVSVDPGFYAFVTARPSTTRMTVELLSSDGVVLDEFAIQSTTVADMILASSTSRLRRDAERLGELVGDYLKARTLPPPK